MLCSHAAFNLMLQKRIRRMPDIVRIFTPQPIVSQSNAG